MVSVNNRAKVLCLASGGGQQGPVLAAAGAELTVFDNFSAQLAQDRLVAVREHLAIRIPYSDLESLPEQGLKERLLDLNEPPGLGSHAGDQLRGQLDAGFVIAGFFEDDWGGESPLDPFMRAFIATRTVKLRAPQLIVEHGGTGQQVMSRGIHTSRSDVD